MSLYDDMAEHHKVYGGMSCPLEEWMERVKVLEKNAARWSRARDFLSMEDIEIAYDNMRGFESMEIESKRADETMDEIIERERRIEESSK